MHRSSLALTVTVLGFVGLVSQVFGDEQKIKLEEVPKAVMKSVKGKFPGAEMRAAAKEVEEGKTRFEVSLTSKGRKYDVIASPSGEILVVEKELSQDEVPAKVMGALKAKYPHAKIKLAEELIEYEDGKEDEKSYEFAIETADKKTKEVVISAAGKIEGGAKETETDKD
jgi:uncharacterized membrane protein YkoI